MLSRHGLRNQPVRATHAHRHVRARIAADADVKRPTAPSIGSPYKVGFSGDLLHRAASGSGETVMVQSSSRSRTRLRCSLRYAREGGFPEVIGFPFARLDIDDDSLTFSGGRLVPFGRPHWTVRRDQITKLEPTSRGVRFYADGFSTPWVVASLFPRRFLAKLRRHGIVAEGPVVPSRWNTI